MPDVWAEPFELEDDAARELSQSKVRFDRLSNAVEMSIAARETFVKHQQPEDPEQLMWVAISRADHAFLTGRKPAAVATKYREALADAPQFATSSARGQLEIFRTLGVRGEFVDAALAAIDALTAPAPSASKRHRGRRRQRRRIGCCSSPVTWWTAPSARRRAFRARRPPKPPRAR